MTTSSPPIRVLIADDSETIRAIIRHYLVEAGCEVVGEAADGVRAVELAAELRPNVITMDITMPLLDGLAATAAIMTQTPTRIVVVCDTQRGDHVDVSFRAMSAGALELVPKRSPGGGGAERWGRSVAESVRLMADIPVVRRRRPSVAATWQYRETSGGVDVIGIVASTGGPPALAQLLASLPAAFPIPILIAQHIAPGFTRGLVRWLDEVARISVVIGHGGMQLRPSTVVLPPDGRDLVVEEHGRIATPESTAACWPSGDRLLGSLAETYGERAGGVVLTGMGRDGAEGLLAIKRGGGFTMAQDQATSVVWGMPGAAVRCGATDQLFPIQHMAIKLVQLAELRRR